MPACLPEQLLWTGAANEITFVETGLGQQAPYRFDMHGIAAMRGTRDRQFLVTKPEGVGRAALDQRDRL